EISNLRAPVSGHRYFTLKDAEAQLRCVMFKYQEGGLRCEPEDGLKVLVRGRLTVYEPRGDYQLVVGYLEPLGLGFLQRAFEQLKARLAAEGLFDAARKRPLPVLPQAIGVVTSPTGAALRDIVTVIQRRFANVHLLVAPVRVQGEGAAAEVASALEALSLRGGLDVVIVARGGGSLEDLWAFNEEVVARAIAASKVPVISAVGHETDYTIADFVADVRAPTPSAAAEIVVRTKADLERHLRLLARRLVTSAKTERAVRAHQFAALCRRRPLAAPFTLVAPVGQRLDDLRARLERAAWVRLADGREAARALGRELALLAPWAALDQGCHQTGAAYRHLRAGMATCLQRWGRRLGVAAGRLDALSPLNVLERGYAIARRLPDRRLVTDAAQVRPGDGMLVTLRHGEVEAEVRTARGGREDR
ncbi:MAG: exodeoxyribonuclease VII large subunit, partial [Candidatus Tectimicrobiota bacterium]